MIPNKITIIVGSGAVENAWVPVLKAFQNITGLDIDVDTANCLFARYIYLLRFYSKPPNADAYDDLKMTIDDLIALKNEICNEIKLAQKEGVLRPRKEFRKILDKFCYNDPNNRFGLISTNWDTVIDFDIACLVKQLYNEDGKNSNCFHIHGSIEFPEHLYLPSETIREDYRSEEESQKIGYNHVATIQFLQEANQILLYGLSLDPLDAELSQVLSAAFSTNSKLREIIIVNPDYKRIRNRVKILLPRFDIKIRCFSPENLEIEV